MGSSVTVRDLRNHGGEVLSRVQAGETLTVTSHGTPIAELRPIRRYLSTAELLARKRLLPPMDAERLRSDIDEIVDQTIYDPYDRA